jgi:cytoskeletal protein RodZ
MIRSIEEGRFFGLTDPHYLKGFIRTYAQFVGLAEEEVMPFFRREYDAQEHEQKLRRPLAPIEPKKSRLSPGWAIVGILTISILSVVGFAYQQYVSVALTPELKVNSPSNQTKTSADQITASGRTDPDATLSLNGQQIQIDPEGKFSTTVGLATGSNTLTFKAVNKLGKESVVERTVVSTHAVAQLVPTPSVLSATASASRSARPAAEHPTTGQLIIGVVIGPSPAWLDVSVDGQPVFTGVLLPGASKSFSAGSGVHVKSGNAGSTRIIFNGRDQGTMGPENKVIERDFTL